MIFGPAVFIVVSVLRMHDAQLRGESSTHQPLIYFLCMQGVKLVPVLLLLSISHPLSAHVIAISQREYPQPVRT
jgi:hypothetical protein